MAYKYNPLLKVGLDDTGNAAAVAGSNGQLIYNNAGAYAGASSTSVGASGDITLSLAGAASTPPVSLTGTWFSGGTSTTTKPQVLIEPAGTTSTAWSTSGTGLGVNAASGFTGNLLDLQVNGASKIKCSGAGVLQTGPIKIGDLAYIQSTYNGTLKLHASARLAWQAGAATDATTNALSLLRGSANELIISGNGNLVEQSNGTNAQTTRIYDTYTSATDYHRIAIATARATLANVSGASVTATGLIPAGAVVMGVTSKVTTGLGVGNGTTGYQIGTGADADRWGDITGTAAGTTSDNRDWTAGTIECFPSATDVIVTAVGGNFDATGDIYLSVQYMTGQAD